jgi:hypothetical protein
MAGTKKPGRTMEGEKADAMGRSMAPAGRTKGGHFIVEAERLTDMNGGWWV